jgi:hypothetical protein
MAISKALAVVLSVVAAATDYSGQQRVEQNRRSLASSSFPPGRASRRVSVRVGQWVGFQHRPFRRRSGGGPLALVGRASSQIRGRGG